MAISSINFQKATSYAIAHNFRESEEGKNPKYHLPQEFHDKRGNEFWRPDKTPEQIFKEEVDKTSRKGGRIPKFENSHREAVINLNKNHTLEDLFKIKEHFESKYRFICCGIALHRDEGHIKELKTKTPIYNYHAHINFITYADGKQRWNFSKKELAQMQSEVAEILGMKRGQEFSKAKRLNHYQYRYAKQKEEASLLKREKNDNDFRKGIWAGIRQDLIKEGGYSQTDYKAIRGIVMDSENNLENILESVAQYRKNHAELAQKSKISSQAISNLENEIKTLKTANNELKEENEELKKENSHLKWALKICHNFLVWLGLKPKDWEIDDVSQKMTKVSEEFSNLTDGDLHKEARDLRDKYIDQHERLKRGEVIKRSIENTHSNQHNRGGGRGR